MIRYIIFVFVAFLPYVALAQTEMAIGQWKLLLPYNSTISVTGSENKIFYATPFSVFSKDKTDGSVAYFDLVNALSQTDIRFIKYDKHSNSLFIIYENSNIDVLTNNEVINLPIIKNKQIFGDKFIYDIFFEGNTAYLSCGFGIVALNTEKLEVDFSTFTENPVKGLAIANGIIYASVTDEIFQVDINNTSIQDFLVWEKMITQPVLPNSIQTGFIGTLNDKIYFGANNVLFSYETQNQTIDTVFAEAKHQLIKITNEGAGLLAVFKCDGSGQWDDCDGKIIYIPKGDNPTIQVIGTPQTFRPVDVAQQGDDLWVVDEWYPFRKIALNGDYEDGNKLAGPNSARAFKTTVFDDTLYVVGGRWSPTKSFPKKPIADGVSFQDLKTGQWGFINRSNFDSLKDNWKGFNFMDIAVHPTTRKKYISSFGGGLIAVNGAEAKVFNATNSSLRSEPGFEDRVAVIGLAFDKKNNLWASNYGTDKSMVVFKEDGSSLAFGLGQGNHFSNRLLVDDFGNKWAIIVSKGLLVLSTGDNLNDRNDDQYKLFNVTNSELQVNTIHDIAMDHDGFIWAGTDEGVVVFDCGGDVFGEFCRGNRRIASLDGFNAYLLADEKVNAVMVDGANRKWFGTTNGVFVLSPSGEEVINTFNISNSPLPSNDIQSISVDNKTGTVFIGTSFGLISYRGEALAGGPIHQEEVLVYPNPVRPDYTGPIAIKGLAQNANVKITDVVGRLVYEFEAQGGQGVWDGRDYNNQKVESGVYLVYSTAQPGLTVDAAVAKIVIIK